MPTPVPELLRGLIDDAAVFPPGNAPLPEALAAHREHRHAWYSRLVGPLLVPVSLAGELRRRLASMPSEPVAVGLVGDTGLSGLAASVGGTDSRAEIRQVEIAVAKRGEDPQPGLAHLLELVRGWPKINGYAEIPLTWGLLAALDTLATARADGVSVAAKFRTGGLAAELFPSPIELAAVICACRDRRLPFKLTAGLHSAIRHTDPETGFVHHGFLNILVATLAAAAGSEPAEVGDILAGTDAVALIEAVRAASVRERPLWIGYGSCSIPEPVADLTRFGLIHEGGA